MANFSTWKNEMRDFIAKNDYDSFFHEVFESITNKEFLDEFIILKSEYNRTEKDTNVLLITQVDKTHASARLNQSCLFFLDKLTEKDIDISRKFALESLEYFSSLIEGFEISEIIGVKKNATLCRAVSKVTKDNVILRFSTNEDKNLLESKLKINHTNLLNIRNTFETKRHSCIEIEYVKGYRLIEILSVGVLPPRSCIKIIASLCDVFEHLLINEMFQPRMLNPNKIFVDSTFNAKVSLFEVYNEKRIADILPKHYRKLLYTSCELLQSSNGEKTHLEKHIQFVLGLFLYKLLTGKRLIGGETMLELLENWKAYIKKPRLKAHIIDEQLVPNPLNKVLETILNPDPKERYQTLTEVSEKLNLALGKIPKDMVVEYVCDSYLRGCRKDEDLINTFYERLFSQNPDYAKMFQDTTKANVQKKVRVALLQMLYLRNKQKKYAPNFVSYYGHRGLVAEDYKIFLETLKEVVRQNDYYWSDNEEKSWNQAIEGIMINLSLPQGANSTTKHIPGHTYAL